MQQLRSHHLLARIFQKRHEIVNTANHLHHLHLAQVRSGNSFYLLFHCQEIKIIFLSIIIKYDYTTKIPVIYNAKITMKNL